MAPSTIIDGYFLVFCVFLIIRVHLSAALFAERADFIEFNQSLGLFEVNMIFVTG